MNIHVRDADGLKRLARDLRAAANGPRIRRELTTAIRRELRPVQAAVRAAYLSRPSRTGHGRLRAALARATTVTVRTTGRSAGARIAVKGQKMPSGMGRLPKLYESAPPVWRHPVYGNRDVWVTQYPTPTFYQTVRPAVPKVREGVEDVADKIVRTITRG